MRKISIAKTVIDGKVFFITNCNLLENELATSIKKIEMDNDVKIITDYGFEVINPTNEFVSDLKKMFAKFVSGERMKYYRGDYDKYYISDYKKIKELYDMLLAKAS